MLTPLARRVIALTRSLNRSRAFGAMTRLTSRPAVKLNPKNFRSCGRATALFASFTLSLSFCVMNCVTLSIAANVHITIIRIPNEAMAPALQLPVEFVEHDVAKQWRKWTSLRSPFHARTGPQQAIAYLGRYTHRVAISNQRLLAHQTDRFLFNGMTTAGHTSRTPR